MGERGEEERRKGGNGEGRGGANLIEEFLYNILSIRFNHRCQRRETASNGFLHLLGRSVQVAQQQMQHRLHLHWERGK